MLHDSEILRIFAALRIGGNVRTTPERKARGQAQLCVTGVVQSSVTTYLTTPFLFPHLQFYLAYC